MAPPTKGLICGKYFKFLCFNFNFDISFITFRFVSLLEKIIRYSFFTFIFSKILIVFFNELISFKIGRIIDTE